MFKTIYLISNYLHGETIYKIGFTKRAVSKRLKELSTGNPGEFEIIKTYDAKDHGASIEGVFHRTYRNKRINGEWFYLDQKEIDSFEEMCETYYQNFLMLSTENTYVQSNNINFK